MICIIALVVFGILGVFSASYRTIAKEAFSCVFLRLTLRKCESGLDKRLKAQLTGKVMRKHPKTGRWLFKYFEILSWIFTLLFVVSIVYTGIAVYNYAAYGNCNGPDSDGFCIFDPLGNEQAVCTIPGNEITVEGPVEYPTVDDDPFLGPEDASLTIIIFGCMTCPFTKQAVPTILEIHEAYPQVKIVYRDFPIAAHDYSSLTAQAAECANEQGKYWEFWEEIFEHSMHDPDDILQHGSSVGLDSSLFSTCMNSNSTLEEVQADLEDGLRAEVRGTPTFFINDEVVVGAQSFKVINRIIKRELKKVE